VPEISVIVLNWNGKHFLETCLTALRRQTFRDFEVILVDNGSTDGTVEYVRDNFPEVKLVALKENFGFTGGNIAGYGHAKGELVVLLNNDTEADEHWLEEMHKASKDYPKAGSFASKMMLFDKRNQIDNCGFDLTSVGTVVDLGRRKLDGPAWCEARKVFGACGGAAGYRRSMLEEVGFFDPDLFMTFDDLDLSFRAQLRGYECMFVPRAIVYHHLGPTIRRHPARTAYFEQRNIDLVYLKNMPLKLILLALPKRLIYEIGCALYFFRLGVGTAFLKAKVDVIRELPAVLRKRREILAKRTVKNSQLRSMLLRYRLGSKWTKFSSAWRVSSQSAARTSQKKLSI
jgi:GT2 family glycosyltransferase